MSIRFVPVLFLISALQLQAIPITVNVPGDTASATGGTYTGAMNDLRGALNYINSRGLDTYTITFTLPAGSVIALAAPLPPLNFSVAGAPFSAVSPIVEINGALPSSTAIVIDGGGLYRPFHAHAGVITLRNLSLQNGSAKGGDGGLGAGGGGAGLGGTLFVDSLATVTLENVHIAGSSVKGGAGGIVAPSGNFSSGGGGGGMGGTGGGGFVSMSTAAHGAGGGGGFISAAPGGLGGTTTGPLGGGGGGGGFFGPGGNGGVGAGGSGGGGGGGGGYGGVTAPSGGTGATPGGSGTAGGIGGTIQGVPIGGGGGGGGTQNDSGGSGGSSVTPCVVPGFGSGAGGGSMACGCGNGSVPVVSFTGGQGGCGGGGGGGTGALAGPPPPTPLSGGAGGVGGGGGGGGGGNGFASGTGGTGGYGAGGGGAGGQGGFGGGGGGALLGFTINGGLGGFGGGGGGAAATGAHNGGNSTYGGGGGGKNGNLGGGVMAGTPGIGGGFPDTATATSGGGGGTALGAAIFVNTGGTLTYKHDSSMGSVVPSRTDANFATATPSLSGSGAGFVGPLAGSAVQEIFLRSGVVPNFVAVQPTDTVIISAAIADETTVSIPVSTTYLAPAPLDPGVSITINSPVGTAAGTVVFNGSSTYGAHAVGATTTIYGGTLQFLFNASLGESSVPFVFAEDSRLQTLAGGVGLSRPITVAMGKTATFDVGGGTMTSLGVLTTGAMSNIIKTGAGTLSLGGSSTISAGTVTVNGGILLFNVANTYSGTTTVNSGGILQGGASNTFSPSSPHVLNGTGILRVNGTQQTINTLTSGSSAAAVELGQGTLFVGDGSSFAYAGQIIGTSPVSSTLVKTGAGTWTLSGSNNSPSAYTVSAGTLLLTGANTYTGLTTIQGGATLEAGAVNAFSSGSTHILNGNASMNLITFNQVIGGLQGGTLTATVQLGSGTLTVGLNGATSSFMGQITGTGGLTVAGGHLTLTGTTSTYMGPTTLLAGLLSFVADGSLGAAAAPIVFGGNGTLQPLNPLTLTRSITVSPGVMGTIQNNVNVDVAGPIVLNAGGSLAKTGSATLTLSGMISGSGGLTSLAGMGPIDLTSNALYTGPTSISGPFIVDGSIQQSAITVFPTGTLTVNGTIQQATIAETGGLVNVFGTVQQTPITITGGTFQVFGSLQQSPVSVSNGTFIVTGSCNQSPITGLSGALLIINGPLTGSPVTVSNGARLQGTGPINPSVLVQSGGTIHAGNSIGTMALSGLTLESGALLQLELAPQQDNCSLYAVTGGVSLGGATLQIFLTQNPNQYTSALTYTFITATSGVTGTFGVVQPSPGFIAIVDYSNPHAVVLRQIAVADIGSGTSLSHNEHKVLSNLQKVSNVAALLPILVNLGFTTGEELQDSLNSISAARNGAATWFANQVSFEAGDMSARRLTEGRMMRHIRQENALSSHLAQVQSAKYDHLVAMNGEFPSPIAYTRKPAGSAKTIASGPANYGFWGAGFGEWMTQESEHSNPKIHDAAMGVIVGFDYFGMQNGIFSLSAGYLHNKITEETHAGKGHSNGLYFDFYGTGTIGNGYIEGGLLFGQSRFHMERNIVVSGPNPFHETASSDFDNGQFMPHVGGGYDWITEWGVIEPFATLDWAISFQESYKETGAFPLNMHVKRETPSILRTQLGVNFYETWERKEHLFVFEQKGIYVNKSPLNTHMTASFLAVPEPHGSFGVQTYDAVLNLCGLGLEFFYKHKRSGFYLSTTYRGEFGVSYTSNDLTGTMGVQF